MGDMMQFPLLTSHIIRNAASRYSNTQVVSKLEDGSVHTYRYKDAYTRIKQLANALNKLGVKQGDCIATIALNNFRHFELYYGISGMGAIVHTVNARLLSQQIHYILQHAQDKFIFIDASLVPLIEKVIHQLPCVKGIIINCSPQDMPTTSLKNVHCYETLIDEQSDEYNWPSLAAHTPCCLCYTSGTTGHPKGVLYSHQSTVTHAMMSGSSQLLDFNQASVVMPMVPMYHVVAWGIPFSAPLYGAKLVLPGPILDGESVHQLIHSEQVNKAYGVPEVWLGLHQYLQQSGNRIPSLLNIGVGGAASPEALVKTYGEEYGVYWMGIWGMTETSPLVTAAIHEPAMDNMKPNAKYRLQASAGRPIFGCEIAIFDHNQTPLPHDGITQGQLKVRGPWIMSHYFKEKPPKKNKPTWFDTGDTATIDSQGYLRIVDRHKDVIKSGDNWISSVQLEDAALNYQPVDEACVISAKHTLWNERPIMLVTLKNRQQFNKGQFMKVLKSHLSNWCLPDAIITVPSLPHTGTGKLKKYELRQQYQNYLLNSALCTQDEYTP